MGYTTRNRDGHTFLSGSEKRAQRKLSGLTGKKDRKLTNERRRYRKGVPDKRGRW